MRFPNKKHVRPKVDCRRRITFWLGRGFQPRIQLDRRSQDMHLVPNVGGQDASCHLGSAFNHAGSNSGLCSEVFPPLMGEGESLDPQDGVSIVAPGVQHRFSELCVWDHQGDVGLSSGGVIGLGRRP